MSESTTKTGKHHEVPQGAGPVFSDGVTSDVSWVESAGGAAAAHKAATDKPQPPHGTAPPPHGTAPPPHKPA